MKRFQIILFLFSFYSFVYVHAAIDLKEVYENVDQEINKWPEYKSRRQARIDSLKTSLFTKDINWADTQFVKCLHIVDEYQYYQNDSAIHYIKMLNDIAPWTTQLAKSKAIVKLKMARQAVRSGMYEAALTYLNETDTTIQNIDIITEYFRIRHFTYIEMSAYCYIWSKRTEYLESAHKCRLRLLSLLKQNSSEWLMYKAYDCLLEKHFKEAEKYSNLCLLSCPQYSDLYRQATFHRRFICECLEQESEAIYWQAESAISELRLGITDQVGLWSLASKMPSGELSRQYRYIRFSWDIISSFGKNARTWQVAPVLSAVEHQYQAVKEHQSRIILIGTVILLIMAILLAFAYFYANKKRRQLTEVNKKLGNYNECLATTNAKLADANRVKESYIIQLLRYYSDFIDIKEEERRSMNKMQRTGNTDALIKMLNAADKTEKEHERLLGHFDDIFLELYPSFVEDLSAMLSEEGRKILNQKDRMNTPLRIFALMRLGIDNTKDVARILHCSTQTIYNYRNSIRNAYLYDRSHFEDTIMGIGIGHQQQE